MSQGLDREWVRPKDGPCATAFTIADGQVVTSALIAGDGVDLVMTRPGCKPQTIQLSVDETRELSAALRQAADESERL